MYFTFPIIQETKFLYCTSSHVFNHVHIHHHSHEMPQGILFYFHVHFVSFNVLKELLSPVLSPNTNSSVSSKNARTSSNIPLSTKRGNSDIGNKLVIITSTGRYSNIELTTEKDVHLPSDMRGISGNSSDAETTSNASPVFVPLNGDGKNGDGTLLDVECRQAKISIVTDEKLNILTPHHTTHDTDHKDSNEILHPSTHGNTLNVHTVVALDNGKYGSGKCVGKRRPSHFCMDVCEVRDEKWLEEFMTNKKVDYERFKALMDEINISFKSRKKLNQFFITYSTVSLFKKAEIGTFDIAFEHAWKDVWKNLNDSLQRFRSSPFYEKWLESNHAMELNVNMDRSVDK